MPQTIMVSQLMEMLESIGLRDEWQWRWNKLRELIDAAEQKRALDGAKCAECLGINGTHSDTGTNNPANAPRK